MTSDCLLPNLLNDDNTKDSNQFQVIFKQGVSRGAASGGSDLQKKDIPLEMLMDFPIFLQFSSRVLAEVLPPAGQIFGKWHLLKIFHGFPNYFAIFKQCASRGAASDGSDF